MILLTHFKAGFGKRGFTGSAGLFSGDGILTTVTLHFAATLLPQGRRLIVQQISLIAYSFVDKLTTGPRGKLVLM